MEKRRQKRVPLKKDVIINEAIRAQTIDLSETGMYIHTSHFFPVGQLLKLRFTLGEDTIRTKAVVQHCEEGIGTGLHFVDIDGEEEALIGEYIESVDEKTEKTEDGKKRVLLVEDNALSRRMNKSRLVLDGFSVLEAADGLEAINILGKEKIDLVVLDLQIPKLDGYKILSLIRENPAWKEMPVLVCSARSSQEEVKKAMAAGATEFLVKITTPPPKLSERIKTHLKTIG